MKRTMRAGGHRATLLAGWALLAGGLLLAVSAHAKSRLSLPYPTLFGEVSAVTYDESGEAIGRSSLAVTRVSESEVRVLVEAGSERGARTRAEAVLAAARGEGELQLIREVSQSYDPKGNRLVHLEIDHVRGEAACTPPKGGRVSRLRLPEDDRVVNVPLNLLFRPLLDEDEDEIAFQLFVCRGGARVVDFWARRFEAVGEAKGNGFVEVRFGPAFGRVMGWLAERFMPRLAFWFEAGAGGRYVAHRMPLYAKGPEVLVVRDGFSPVDLPALR